MNDSHSQPPDAGATEAQPQATTDHRSAVYAREPGHSHATDQPCYPEACTGHPSWKAIQGTPGVAHAGGYVPPRVVDVGVLADRVAALEAWRIGVAPDDRGEPCETGPEEGDSQASIIGGSLRMPRMLVGDRADRAEAMLGTAETVIATGSAAEVGGVRLEACDEYGRTATTEALELQRAALRKARAERDMALAGAESAERDAGPLEGPAPTPADPADYGTDTDARHHQERADRLRRDRDQWREKAHGADRELLRLRRDKAELKRELDTPRLGCATTAQLIAELAARAEVAATIGEKWPSYRTVDSQ